MPISENDALFTLIGTTYGGDGQTTFALPNLQSRGPIHQGQGPSLSSRQMGESFGTEEVTITVAQLPAHTHPALCSTSGQSPTPVNNFFATDGSGNIAPYNTTGPNSTMAAQAVGAAGGSQPHDNMQPYLVMNYIICTTGIFPTQS